MDDVAENPPTECAVFKKAIHDELLYTASIDGQVVGFALSLNHGKTCHLEQMSVDPSFGRRGVGASLVDYLIADAKTRGYQTISLSTFFSLPWNAPFYAKLGFDVVNTSDLTNPMLEVQIEESEAGLDMNDRVIMILELNP